MITRVEELTKELLRVYGELGEELFKDKEITSQYLWENGWKTTHVQKMYRYEDIYLTLDADMEICWEDETWYKGNIPTIGEFETLRKLLEI